MRSVALANQKGGVGKTTIAVHLAHGLSMAGGRAALFDLDPQGNATVAVQSMVVDDASGPMLATRGGFSLLPSPGAERSLERGARLQTGRLLELAESLEEDGLEWLIVDCPPRMDEWGWAGLQICQQVLVPVQAEFFAMHGLSQMMETMAEAREAHPGRSALLGVLANMVDLREPVAREVLEDLRENLDERLMETVVYRDSQLVEAASHGSTVFEYNPFSKGARSFAELVREVRDGRSSTG